MRRPPEPVREDDTASGDLRHSQIDEDNATIEHLNAERHMSGGDEEPSNQRRPYDAQVRSRGAHFVTASSRAKVSSYNPNRSFARSVPPTVYGNITDGILARSAINSAA